MKSPMMIFFPLMLFSSFLNTCYSSIHYSSDSPILSQNAIPSVEEVFPEYPVTNYKKTFAAFNNRYPLPLEQYQQKKAEIDSLYTQGDKKKAWEIYWALLLQYPDLTKDNDFFSDILNFLLLSHEVFKNVESSLERNFYPVIEACCIYGYQIAKTPEEKAAILLMASEFLYEKDRYYYFAKKLFPIASLRKKYPKLAKIALLKLSNFKVNNDASSPSVCFEFSFPIEKTTQTALDSIFTLSPLPKGIIQTKGKTVCIDGLEFGKTYKCNISNQLQAVTKDTLAKAYTIEFTVPDRPPKISFESQSYVLFQEGDQYIPISSINVNKFKVELYKISEREWIPFLGYTSHQIYENALKSSGKKLWNGSLDVTPELNKSVVTNIPLKTILSEESNPGIYILKANVDDATVQANDRYLESFQKIVITDLGMSSTKGNDGLHVWIRSLKTAKPYEKATVQLIAKNNSVLASGVTDDHGYIKFDAELLRGKEGQVPFGIYASHPDGGFLYSKDAQCHLDLSHYKITGHPVSFPINCFLYTDRGIYLPGETVFLNGVVKDGNGVAHQGVPLTLKLKRPGGNEVLTKTCSTNSVGLFAHDFPIARSFMSGVWNIEVYTDPKLPPIQVLPFQVGEFIPPSIDFSVTHNQENLYQEKALELMVKGHYLFGAPAQHLGVEGKLTFKALANPFGLKGFCFGDEGKRTSDEEKEVLIGERTVLDFGKTNEQGVLDAQLECPTLPEHSFPLQASLLVSFFEPGGRPLNKLLEIPIIEPTKTFIGIKPLFTNQTVKIGSESRSENAKFEILLINGEGKAMDGDLQYTLFEEIPDYQWYQSPDNFEWTYKFTPKETILHSGKIQALKEGPQTLSLPTLTRWGTYLLKIFDTQGKTVSWSRFHVGWNQGNREPKCPTAFPIKLDKETYKVGETVNISMEMPFAGEALIQVVSSTVIESKQISLHEKTNTFALKVTPEWGSGAYVIVSAFRPFNLPTPHSFVPKRAVGVSWISIDKPASKIAIQLNVPEEIRPNEELKVELSSNASEPVYFSAFLVDEGILNLTRFSTPDPFDYFYGKKQLEVSIFDIYGYLIASKKGKLGILRSGSGGESLLNPSVTALISHLPSKNSMALSSGIIPANEKGETTIQFKIPKFNGQGRLMVTAFTKNGAGTVSKNILIRDPVIFSAYTPRFLLTDDSAFLAYRVTKTDSSINEAKLSLDSNENINLQGPSSFNFSWKMDPAKEYEGFLPIEAKKEGSGQINEILSLPSGITYKRETNIPIYQNFLIKNVYQEFFLAPGESKTFSPQEFCKNLSDCKISLETRNSLLFPATRLWKDLKSYPFGCSEQKISKIFPLLHEQKLKGIIPEFPNSEKAKNLIQQAILDLVLLQNGYGSITQWTCDSDQQCSSRYNFLTLYGADFFSRAHKAGYKVPQFVFDRFHSFWKNEISSYRWSNEVNRKARSQLMAYGFFVFSKMDTVNLSDIRYFLQTSSLQHGAETSFECYLDPLSRIYLGAVFARLGDIVQAKSLFSQAIALLFESNTQNDAAIEKPFFSTPLWQIGESFVILSEISEEIPLLKETLTPYLNKLSSELYAHYKENIDHLSTTEQSILLCASAWMPAQPNPSPFSIEISQNNEIIGTLEGLPNTLSKELQLSFPNSSTPVSIKNSGKSKLWVNTRIFGKELAPTPKANGITLKREFFTLEGKPINLSTIHQNDLICVVLSGECTFKDVGAANLLLIDRLPAGFEIESSSEKLSSKELPFLDSSPIPSHQEKRDNFYASFLHLEPMQSKFRCTYFVRAVTLGTFSMLPASIEDMYRPRFYGQTSSEKVKIIPFISKK